MIYGSSLQDLTRKMQNLVGAAPVPPLWALGHQQCKWGYEDQADLDYLDECFSKYEIPADGLWLDIDYMDGFRVFTFDGKKFPKLKKGISRLNQHGRKVVPIIDPGVKLDPGYSVYDDGKEEDVFCKTAAGTDYVGIVWPGETVFPDFSLRRVREWWAKHVAEFAANGIYGAWLDMNDPSTGSVECLGMRFDDGKYEHEAYHNQYALGMAKATYEGFLKAHPETRPFLLCRSGFTGTSKYTAIWTGDNHSNYEWLSGCIPTSLNLSLSGISFNGPDIGGFGQDTTEKLMIHWEKACFLFPVHRNHAGCNAENQEPWRFSEDGMKVLRHYIRLRYKLLPYLYNLFVNHEEVGDPILRPLFYHFEDTENVSLGKINDQFLVGDSLLQAPIVQDVDEREFAVPEGNWFDFRTGEWISGDINLRVADFTEATVLLGKEGSVIPMRPGKCKDNKTDLTNVELHILLNRDSKTAGTYEYVCDDGSSYEYRNGKRSRVNIHTKVKNQKLSLSLTTVEDGFGPVNITPVFYDTFKNVSVTINGKKQAVTRTSTNLRMTGRKFEVFEGTSLSV